MALDLSVLENLGYSLSPFGVNYRTSAIYRGGSAPNSIQIYPEDGRYYDFVKKQGGTLYHLCHLTLKNQNPNITQKEIEDTIDDRFKQAELWTKKAEKLKQQTQYPEDALLKLKKDHSYWIKRGVSAKTLNLFEGGVANKGPMANRYVFPIRGGYNKSIRGFCGRWILPNRYDTVPKWKKFPSDLYWRYPSCYNERYLKESKTVILVESIGDCLALWDAGIKNTLVCFTAGISGGLRNYIVSLDPDKIYVCFNNDKNKLNNIGKQSAIKTARKLCAFFDRDQIVIKLPSKNDFGEMTKEEIGSWHQKIKN